MNKENPDDTTASRSVGYGLNNPATDSNGVTTWDCVWFGSYWQEDTNGDGEADQSDAKQPIKWRVLSVNGDDAFLLADKNLDCQRYHDNDMRTNVTWKTCTVRSWLNGYGAGANKEGRDYRRDNFLDSAFTSAEQSAIRTTKVVNDDNSYYGTAGGKDTFDKIYLLSVDEATNPSYGFISKLDETKTRRAVNTTYASGEGEMKSYLTSGAGKSDVWLLRSPGYWNTSACEVCYYGSVYHHGDDVNYGNAVRPALHLNLSSASSWSYAGTVISEGGEIEPASPAVIRVGKVTSMKLTQKKKKLTASWKKVPGAFGYQIRYSTSKKWKGKKEKLNWKNKVTLKNLKKEKTYYVRVRAYRLDGAKKVYGSWSKTKKIKMK